MKVNETAKCYTAVWNQFQTGSFTGWAKVYYTKSDWDKVAKHYGWPGQKPNELVEHMGCKTTLFEVLHQQLNVYRVVR